MGGILKRSASLSLYNQCAFVVMMCITGGSHPIPCETDPLQLHNCFETKYFSLGLAVTRVYKSTKNVNKFGGE